MELTQNNLQAQVKEILHKCRFSKINIIHLIRNWFVNPKLKCKKIRERTKFHIQ